MVGGSGRSEASPTAILKDTHSVEGAFLEVRMYGVLRSSDSRSCIAPVLSPRSVEVSEATLRAKTFIEEA